MEKGELPCVGPTEALGQAATAGERISAFIDNPVFAAEDRQVLAVVIERCMQAETWTEAFERFCCDFPRTLVHCDFVAKNLRVSCEQQLMVFDWEMAGYGPPAADLAECDDLPAYTAALDGPMSERSLQEVQTLALIGKVLRWAAAVDWASWGLDGAWVRKPLRNFRCYANDMEDLVVRLKEAGIAP